MKRWKARCARCGNPRHFLPFYLLGMLAWHLVARWWPFAWGVPPFLPTAGDYAFDHRQCEWSCGPATFDDVPEGGPA